MLKFRDYSMPQRVATISLVLAVPLIAVATHVWSSAPLVLYLPFVFPIAVVFLAWSLLKTELRLTGQRPAPAPPDRAITLGLGPAPPSRLGGRMGLAGQMSLLLMATPNVTFPHEVLPEWLYLVYFCWVLAASAFIVFGLHRLLPEPNP